MSAKTWQGESQLTSLLREENIVETRPITPPCRNVVGGPVSSGLLVLPPDTVDVQFNSEVTITAQSNKRHGSADRIQRKLRSVERSNSAGGRLSDERNFHPSGVLDESKKYEPVQKELKSSQPLIRNADVNPEDAPQQMSNGTSQTVDEINISLDKLHVNEGLPFESKAEFLSCVMEKNYDKALHLCNEMLAIDPENNTLIDYQNVITEKLQQEASSEEDSEDDGSGTDDPDNEDDDDDNDESGDGDDEEDGEDGDEDEEEDDESGEEDDEEEGSESSSDSDIELPPGPINLLMGGLPLRPSSAQPYDHSGNT